MTNYSHILETALRKFKKAKRIAVENFTMSADTLDMATEINLSDDTRAYKWNRDTVEAIRYVIRNKQPETLAGACACGNRAFVLPKVETLIPAPAGWDSIG